MTTKPEQQGKNKMDIFTSRMLEEESKPSFFGRLILRIRFGKDKCCDKCYAHTWWNGNIWKVGTVKTVVCDSCLSSLLLSK